MLCMEEVEEHKKKAKEMKDKALRALADMENARMRHQKEVKLPHLKRNLPLHPCVISFLCVSYFHSILREKNTSVSSIPDFRLGIS